MAGVCKEITMQNPMEEKLFAVDMKFTKIAYLVT